MDSDIIVSIIIWIAVVLVGMLLSRKRKPVNIKARLERMQPRNPAPRPKPGQERWALLDSAPRYADFQPESLESQAKPMTASLPQEGVRATVRKSAPMAPNEKKKPWLANRDNLIRAIVLGEVLNKNFDSLNNLQ